MAVFSVFVLLHMQICLYSEVFSTTPSTIVAGFIFKIFNNCSQLFGQYFNSIFFLTFLNYTRKKCHQLSSMIKFLILSQNAKVTNVTIQLTS